jgi:hypothetical protein
MKSRTIYGLAAAIAVSDVALMAINGLASAATRPASVNYCLQCGHGGSDCSFTSKARSAMPRRPASHARPVA